LQEGARSEPFMEKELILYLYVDLEDIGPIMSRLRLFAAASDLETRRRC
jgi:hypothetical protein